MSQLQQKIEDLVVINKIEIKIGETKLALSLAQAKQLKEALDDLFQPVRTITIERQVYPSLPWNWTTIYQGTSSISNMASSYGNAVISSS